MSDEAEAPPEPDRRGEAPHPREAARLFGQEAAEASFLEAVRSGRLHHAWLVTGPSGVGKATLAWRIARFMLDPERAGRGADSLDTDPGSRIFRQVRQLAAPGLYLCRRPWDARAKRLRAEITVEEARGLKNAFQLSAPDGAWRVAIIDTVDEMNTAAANALLKILEEPPPQALLLLISHRPSRLLPTIRSRCRELRCRPLGPDDMALALGEAGGSVDRKDAARLADLSGGSVGDALEFAEGGAVALHGDIAAILASGPPLDRTRIRALAESCAGTGAEAAARFRLVLRLSELAMTRLARAGAGMDVSPVSGVEETVLERLGATQAQSGIWAERAGAIRIRAETARAVNLDPAQVILDTFLQIDAAAAEALRLAA